MAAPMLTGAEAVIEKIFESQSDPNPQWKPTGESSDDYSTALTEKKRTIPSGSNVRRRKRDPKGYLIPQLPYKHCSRSEYHLQQLTNILSSMTESSLVWGHDSRTSLFHQSHYNLCLPSVQCPSCHCQWTPGIVDLLAFRYWPATTSCQTIYTFDVFTSFENIKSASAALSQEAFFRMLEHRVFQTGREGRICGTTFHRSYREFMHCTYKEEELCLEEPFLCPACTLDMLAVSADGNRKQYRFKNCKGIDEPPLFDGVFIAADDKVARFIEHIRRQMPRLHLQLEEKLRGNPGPR
ncbi:hypothetical protein GJAV_G00142950 [Gymnothorax javanicus]|nr:hypothetical protein GJAV_G00142950 [Gymnothorax javanicus]